MTPTTPPEIDILIEDESWGEAELQALAETSAAAALAHFGLDPRRFEISILACDDTRIAELNADFRGKPQPTNVLSWPADHIELPLGQIPALPSPGPDSPPHELGDIAVAHATCAREAADQGKAFAHHLSHLLVHSTLHLLGFDHINDADAELMEAQETLILETLGIPDPY